jgi:hypothetical protein
VWTADAATQASGDIAGAFAAEGVARVDPRVRVGPGERVTLAVDVDRLHFFDAETGVAIEGLDDPRVVPLSAKAPVDAEPGKR